MKKPAVWYFDFISPFAYFGFQRLGEFAPLLDVQLRPILFAGLLNHWGQKGPAEVAPKRLWTYRWCLWLADREGIPFQIPAAHPFNPLPYLRMALACGGQTEAVRTIFEAIWTTGANPGDAAHIEALMQKLGLRSLQANSDIVKAQLRANGDEAIGRGVFGVPTLHVEGENFWGADATDFALAWLADPSLLHSPQMQRIAQLPAAASRKP